MTTSVNSILDKAGIILQDTGATRWTRDELLLWLNDGQRELANLPNVTDAKIKRADQSLIVGAKQAVPADLIVLLDLAKSDGSAVLPCLRATLDAFSPGWPAKRSAQLHNYMYDPADPLVFYVYPAQSDTSLAVTLTYSAYPGAVTAGGNIDVQDKYAGHLLSFVLFQAYSKDAEVAQSADLAASYLQLFSTATTAKG